MSEDVQVSGHCYCGGIEFELHIPEGEDPIFTAYCHCESCRRAHAAPLYQVACIDESCFRITKGEDLLETFQRPGAHLSRAFCRQCGSKIVNRFGEWKPKGKTPVAVFPSLLDQETQQALPEKLRPVRINRPDECVLDLERLLTD